MYQIKGNNTNVNINQNGTKQIGTLQNGTDQNGINENGTKQTAAKTCPVPLERCKFCQALLRSTYQVQILLAFFLLVFTNTLIPLINVHCKYKYVGSYKR